MRSTWRPSELREIHPGRLGGERVGVTPALEVLLDHVVRPSRAAPPAYATMLPVVA